MKIDYEVAFDCFELDSSLPGGLRHSIHRPKSYFKDPRRYSMYQSTYAGNPAGKLSLIGKSYYWVISLCKSSTASHRVIWMLSNESYIPDGMIVDHEDGDTQNNSPSNLRICTPTESSLNRSVQCNNVTGLKGVVFNSSRKGNKYRAKIHVNGKEMYLGIFPTANQAHEAYVQASLIHHGEFARS